jgi:hypothetical protein
MVNWDHEDSVFSNLEEIEKWQNKCCGIACLRMVLDYYQWDYYHVLGRDFVILA